MKGIEEIKKVFVHSFYFDFNEEGRKYQRYKGKSSYGIVKTRLII